MEVVVAELISEINKGILKWYPFSPGAKCLYVGDESDAVFEMLTDKEDTFLVKDLDVDVVAPQEIDEMCANNGTDAADKRYDYIISIASIEVLQDVPRALKILSKYLKDTGHMLLGFNNRLGSRYFFGDQDPYTHNIMDGIEDYRRAYSKSEDEFLGRCYDKATIIDMFNTCGLRHSNYSVYPDLENVQLMLRDDYESNEDLAIRVLPTYNHPDTVFMEEEFIYTAFQKNNMTHQMANAYLFDCTFADEEQLDVVQITSSMGRDKKDSFFTLIHGESAPDSVMSRGVSVEKLPAYLEGASKLSNMMNIANDLRAHGVNVVDMDYDPSKSKSLTMPYIDAPTAQSYLMHLIESDEDKFLEKLDEFINIILQSSDHMPEGTKAEIPGDDSEERYNELAPFDGIILKKACPDLLPLNCFYVDGEFVFFDQEFEFDNYPANMMVSRTLNSMAYTLNITHAKTTLDDLRSKYGLDNRIDTWYALEWMFVGSLRKEDVLRFYFEKKRHDSNRLYSNRVRMNFSSDEYTDRFINVFNNLGNKQVVLFGSGSFAKRFMEMYGEHYNVVAVADNRSNKWGENFYDVKIIDPKTILNYDKGTYRVVICIKNFLSVTNQLRDMGIKDYAIFDPNQKYVIERRGASNTQPSMSSDANNKPKKYHTGYIAGVFDLFHVGHLEKFKLAKEQCEHLIVGLVTDEGVRKYKKTEPFIPYEDRKAMLEGCRYVDEVVKIPVDLRGTKEAWRMYGFDVQFSGSDYIDDPGWLAEKEFLEDHGVDMVFFPYTESTSSSKLKELIEQKLL